MSRALVYVLVWLGLVALTVTTYLLSRVDLGAFNTPVALLIAGGKSALVVFFFMHLREHHAANRAAFGLALLFVALLIGFVVMDVVTRLSPVNPRNSPFPEVPGSGYSGPIERSHD